MGGHHHGTIEHRGFNKAAKTRSGRVRSKRFANRFANLEPYDRSPEFLDKLGSVTVDNDELVGPMLGEPSDNEAADVSAGMGFFAQFIDHELTFDPTSALDRREDPRALRNFRTPALDLDSVYGGGAEVRPFLYRPGRGQAPHGAARRHTSDRRLGHAGRAVRGDRR